MIIGAPGYSGKGRAFVYHGSPAGLLADPAWTGEIAPNGTHFGRSVCSLGDINGDSYSDVAIGAPWYDGGQTDEGAVFVYHGSSTGLMHDPVWVKDGNLDNGGFGFSVAGAGDVNGDGFNDLIVGAIPPNPSIGGGAAFLFHGSASGLSAAANWQATCDQPLARFGLNVSSAGDINGDGYADIGVSAHKYNNDKGRVFIYHGSKNGAASLPSLNFEGDME